MEIGKMKITAIKRALPAASVLALLVFAAPVHAQESLLDGWYVGGSLGLARNTAGKNDLFGNPALCLTAAYTCSADKTGLAFQAFVGKNITPFLAVEIGYANLGKSAAFKYTQPLSSGKLTQRTQVLTFELLGKYHFSDTPFSIFGKGGVGVWFSKMKYDRTPNSATFYDRTTHDSGVTPIIGAGIEFDTNSAVKIRAGVDHFFITGKRKVPFDVGNNVITTAKTGATVFYIGTTINFPVSN